MVLTYKNKTFAIQKVKDISWNKIQDINHSRDCVVEIIKTSGFPISDKVKES